MRNATLLFCIYINVFTEFYAAEVDIVAYMLPAAAPLIDWWGATAFDCERFVLLELVCCAVVIEMGSISLALPLSGVYFAHSFSLGRCDYRVRLVFRSALPLCYALITMFWLLVELFVMDCRWKDAHFSDSVTCWGDRIDRKINGWAGLPGEEDVITVIRKTKTESVCLSFLKA